MAGNAEVEVENAEEHQVAKHDRKRDQVTLAGRGSSVVIGNFPQVQDHQLTSGAPGARRPCPVPGKQSSADCGAPRQ